MAEKPLRPYQRAIVQAVLQAFETLQSRATGRSECTLAETASSDCPGVLVYLPTGGGKTRIAAEIIKLVLAKTPAAGVLFVVNRNALVSQAAVAFGEFGLDVGLIKAGQCPEPHKPVQIASIQTLAARYLKRAGSEGVEGVPESEKGSRLPLPAAHLIIIDEAHAAASASYGQLLRAYRHRDDTECASTVPKMPLLLGLTATPMRLGAEDQMQLTATFEILVRGPPVQELINAGVLVPPVVIDASSSAPAARKGEKRLDGAGGMLAARNDGPEAVPPPSAGVNDTDARQLRGIVEKWTRYAAGRTTIVFAADVAHSMALSAAFLDAGVPASHVDGTTPETARASMFAALAAGELLVLSSVAVLSEGFDCCRVSCVVLVRPTHSKALYLQQVGRGLRCYPGKADCVVLDVAGNTLRHGPITGPVGFEYEWDVEEGGGGDVAAAAALASAEVEILAAPVKEEEEEGLVSSAAAKRVGSPTEPISTGAVAAGVRVSRNDEPTKAASTAAHYKPAADGGEDPDFPSDVEDGSSSGDDDAGSSDEDLAGLSAALAGVQLSNAVAAPMPRPPPPPPPGCCSVRMFKRNKVANSAPHGACSSGKPRGGSIGEELGKDAGGWRRGALFVPRAWVCRASDCGAVNHLGLRSCQRCRAVKPLSNREFGSNAAAASAKGSVGPAGFSKGGASAANCRPGAAGTAPNSAVVAQRAAAGGPLAAGAAAALVGISALSLLKASQASAGDVSASSSFVIPRRKPAIPTGAATTSGAPFVQSTLPFVAAGAAPPSASVRPSQATVSSVASTKSGALPFSGAEAASSATRPTSDAASGGSPFFEAVAKLGLPVFTPAMARNDWEREFLSSLARQVTPGLAHPAKRDGPAESRPPSERQAAVLHRIVAAARGGAAGPVAAASRGGGPAPQAAHLLPAPAASVPAPGAAGITSGRIS